jgi:hypothetical protein
MKHIPGSAITVFLLFFGLSLLDAIFSGQLLRAGLWLGIGLIFVAADVMNARRYRERRASTGTASGK